MINYWKSLSIVLCQLSIVLACSRENEELFLAGEPEAIAFPAGSFREGWVSSNPAGATGTRVSDNTWTTGDAVGIYMLPTAVTDLTDNDVWINRKHIVDASGNLNPDGAANTLYYPLNGSSVCFVAYYPYASGATSTHKLTVEFADQSDKAKKEAMDFCFHRGTTSYTSASVGPALGFSHKFCKILINLSKGSGGPSAKDVQVRLSGMPKTAGVDLNKLSQEQTDGITVSTDSVTVKAYTRPDSTDDAATVEAIVAPHSGTDKFAGRKFTFIAAGEEKVYELPDTVTFVAGKVYTFTLEMVVAGITLQEPTLVSDGMTNCYIVAPNTTLRFPVSRAYIHDGTDFTDNLRVDDTTPYTGTFTAAVVWADAGVINGTPTVTGSGNSAIVTVKTTADPGNAVVKICRSDNGEAVWSYHIWVTDYDPNAAGATYTNTMNTNNKNSSDGHFIFMDRNLGATKASLGSGKGTGLFYQWGRKDPFPATMLPGIGPQPGGGSFTAVKTDATLGTVTNTIKNPGVFYSVVSSDSGSEYDWLYAARDNTLWGHDANGGIKTIYDPCPSGWRVPVNYNMTEDASPWNGFTKDNGGTFANGYNWGTNAVYPAAGYRGYTGGSLSFVGVYGFYWNASPSSSSSTNYDASNLRFDSGNVTVNVNTNAYRANGFSVRCSQE